MMDKYFDQVFSSYSWSDSDVKERSSWSCSESEHANEMFCGSVGVDEDDNNSSHTYMTNSNQSLESLVAQDASSVNVHDFESDAQDDGKNCNTNVPHGSFKVENLPLQYDVENVGFSNCEPSMFQRFNNDFETLSPIPQVWSLQSYNGASSCLSSAMDQHKRRSFDMKGEYGDNGIYAMPSNPNDLPALATTEQVKQDLGNYPLPPFASTPQIAMAMPALQPFPQSSTAPSSECTTGTAKPRTRARRGQATDPHSIAERLRREKIAERLKNLQELVPNSNKNDKASMLDEIIEYVKSLQLQVKELSMDTQGTAGAPVAPLITASQRAKGVNGSLISPSISQVADVSFNEIALEQVVRLMETDMSKAMQLLQTNLDLCLMPIALADAVAAEKESSASSPAAPLASGDRKKTTSDDVGHVQNNSSSSSSSNSNSSLPDQQVKQEVNNISFTAA